MFQIAATIGHAMNCRLPYVFPVWDKAHYFRYHIPQAQITISHRQVYKEKRFAYDDIPFVAPNMDLEGYFQSWKYFDHVKDFIKLYFTFSSQVISSAIMPDDPINYTAVHVRRGDYLTLSDYHYNLGMDYYNKAMEMLPGKFMIFSDDPNWCKENFKGDNIHISENREAADLFLMTLCRNVIMANSSFSWWGAYLNDNPEKEVICPKIWFGPKLNHDTKDLYLPEWILI